MMLYWEKSHVVIKSIVKDKILNAKTIKDNSINGKTYLVIGSGFDIETSKIQTPYGVASYCYHWQFSLGRLTIAGRKLETMTEFMKYLSSTIKSKFYNTRLLVFDANLGFEYHHCINEWESMGMSELFTKDKRNPLKIVVDKVFEFRECIGLFGGSLAQIAESYSKVPKLKGDLDYSLCRLSSTIMKPKEKAYCDNDVQILSYLGEYVFEHFFGENPTLPFTATGIIRNKIKRRIGQSLPFVKQQIQQYIPEENLYNTFRYYLFKGGICGTNAKYMNILLHDVIMCDLVSDYPACMNHYKFPSGELTEILPSEFLLYENIPYIATIEFRNIRSKSTHSFLSTSKALEYDENPHDTIVDNGRIFKSTRCVFIVNDIEFKAIQKAYTFDFKIIKAWRFEEYRNLPTYLLDVLNEEYLVKCDLKERHLDGTLEYKDSKKVVNGTYGMTVTSIFTEEYVLNDNGEIQIKKNPNGSVYKKEFSKAIKSTFLSPFWGFWITSYARSILMDIISRFPNPIVQYDTDSIYFIKNHPDTPQLLEYIHKYNEQIERQNTILFKGNKHYRSLGTWEISKPYADFKALGSKRYMYAYYDKGEYTVKTTIAGCRKGTVLSQWEYEVSENGYQGTVFDFFTNGMVIDKEHSKKLAPKYIPNYDGEKYFIVNYKDYLGNEETIKLESGIVLEEIEFKMGLAPATINFYQSLQSLYRNTNNHEICKIVEEILYGED